MSDGTAGVTAKLILVQRAIGAELTPVRGLELLLGMMLLSAGAGTLPSTASVAMPEEFTANMELRAARYSGAATVHAWEAAVDVEGPFESTIRAERATLTVYRYDTLLQRIEVPGHALEFGVNLEYDAETRRIPNSTFNIRGTPDGTLAIWPTQRNAVNFSLAVASIVEDEVRPSATTEAVRSHDSEHTYLLRAPIVALAHGRDGWYGVHVSQTRFEQLEAMGDIQIIVENASIEIETGESREVIQVQIRRTAGGEPLPTGRHEVSYAVLTLHNASLAMQFQDVRAAFLAKESRWHIEGSVDFAPVSGTISNGSQETDVSGKSVRLTGTTAMRLVAQGASDMTEIGAWGTPGALLPEPTARTHMASRDVVAVIDGVAFITLPASGTRAEPLVVSTLLGVLILVWGAARRVVLVALALVIKDPLRNARRQEIIRFLDASGMSHVREIQRATRIPLGTLGYHLRVLAQAGHVTSVEQFGYRVYFPGTTRAAAPELERLALLAHPTRLGIALALRDHETLSQGELARRLALTAGSASRQLRRLVAAGLIERHGGRNIRYHASPLLRDWLARQSSSIDRRRLDPK